MGKEEEEEFVPWTDDEIPDEFKCPISLEIMKEPVLCSDGFYYERECIIDWLHHHNRSPMTNLNINNPTITDDYHLKHKISKWMKAKWDIFNNQNDGNNHRISMLKKNNDNQHNDNMNFTNNDNMDRDINMNLKINHN